MNYNTNHNTNLRVPRCHLEITKQRNKYIGSLEYNNLPQRIKICISISLFKIIINNIEMLLI